MKKRNRIQTPFFEVGPKTFLWGENALDLAMAADEFSARYQVDIIFTAQATDLERIARATSQIHVYAQSMDVSEPGAQFGAILPEALLECGAEGVMLNHTERPISLPLLCSTVCRARDVGLATLVCAGDCVEARAVACLKPDVVLVESPALIGGGYRSQKELDDIPQINREIRSICASALIMHAAGIRTPNDVYDVIYAGAEGTGSTSAIMKASNPVHMLESMILAVRKAWDNRKIGGTI